MPKPNRRGGDDIEPAPQDTIAFLHAQLVMANAKLEAERVRHDAQADLRRAAETALRERERLDLELAAERARAIAAANSDAAAIRAQATRDAATLLRALSEEQDRILTRARHEAQRLVHQARTYTTSQQTPIGRPAPNHTTPRLDPAPPSRPNEPQTAAATIRDLRQALPDEPTPNGTHNTHGPDPTPVTAPR
jgi:hypothetical protein